MLDTTEALALVQQHLGDTQRATGTVQGFRFVLISYVCSGPGNTRARTSLA